MKRWIIGLLVACGIILGLARGDTQEGASSVTRWMFTADSIAGGTQVVTRWFPITGAKAVYFLIRDSVAAVPCVGCAATISADSLSSFQFQLVNSSDTTQVVITANFQDAAWAGEANFFVLRYGDGIDVSLNRTAGYRVMGISSRSTADTGPPLGFPYTMVRLRMTPTTRPRCTSNCAGNAPMLGVIVKMHVIYKLDEAGGFRDIPNN